MTVPGNAYPAVQLDSRGEVVDSGVVLQFTDSTDQPGSGGGGSNPGLFMEPISGSPLGVTTPTGIGYCIQDTDAGAIYQATTADSSGWVLLGGDGANNVPGVVSSLGEAALGDGSGTVVEVNGGNINLSPDATGNFVLVASFEGQGMLVTDDGNNTNLGFFGATPVAQPAAPILLSDVIAALQALGLVGM